MPKTPEKGFIKLKLKTLLQTNEAYLVDLGLGNVWIPADAVKSSRLLGEGIVELEVLEEVLIEKRQGLRRLKELKTGVKGSIVGEVLDLTGDFVEETDIFTVINLEGKKLYFPKVCLAETEKLPDGRYRFVIQKDFFDYKLQQLELDPGAEGEVCRVKTKVIRETDRAYLFNYQGVELWFPRRAVIDIVDDFLDTEIIVPKDFWFFKVEKSIPPTGSK